MGFLEKLFNRNTDSSKNSQLLEISKDTIAELLHTNPELIEQFEKSYSTHVLNNEESDNYFDINSRQAAEKNHSTEKDIEIENKEEVLLKVDTIIDRIVNELLEQTPIYRYDEQGVSIIDGKELIESKEYVEHKENTEHTELANSSSNQNS
jgi:hypothetical protein